MRPRKNPAAIIVFLIVWLFGFAAVDAAVAAIKGDPMRGGKLYAAWDRTTGVDEDALPSGEHPLWGTQTANQQTGIYTWRCSSCHGWDYLGAQGAFGKGRPGYTGFPGVLQTRDLPSKEVRAWLDGSNNRDHNFTEYLGEDDIESLILFLNTQLIELPLIINPETGDSLGNGQLGEDLYKNECKVCHGTDGAKINFGSASTPDFVGNRGDDNPWKVVHWIRFGHQEAIVPTSDQFGWSVIEVADLLAYIQVLPTALLPEPTPPSVEKLDYSNQGDTRSLVFAAVVISLVVIGGVGLASHREKGSLPGKQ